MKGLYLLLDGLMLLLPVILSFDKRIHYIEKWRSVFFAALIVTVPFLIWDFIFTEHGFLEFNPDYLVGINIGNLPIEEVLFFIAVSFASTFIYESVKYYFRRSSFKSIDRIVRFAIPIYALILTLIETTGWYTLSAVVSSTIVLFLWLRSNQLKFIGISFLISLIPFLVVKGILTGGATSKPVIWYSEIQKVTTQIWTIPMEDVLYCFTLVVAVYLLSEFFEKKRLA